MNSRSPIALDLAHKLGVPTTQNVGNSLLVHRTYVPITNDSGYVPRPAALRCMLLSWKDEGQRVRREVGPWAEGTGDCLRQVRIHHDLLCSGTNENIDVVSVRCGA